MSVAHYFDTMDYGPAPESDAEARAWLTRHDSWLRPLHRRRIGSAARQAFRHARAGHRQGAGRDSRKDSAADIDAAVKAARKAQAGWAKLGGPCTGAPSLCAGPHDPAPCAAASRWSRALDNGKPSAKRAISTCRWRPGISIIMPAGRSFRTAEFPDYQPVGVVGPDHPVEFPVPDAGLESGAGFGARQHGGAEARRIHLAVGAAVRRTGGTQAGLPPGVLNIVTGDGETGAALVEHQGCRQDRLHRIDRGRAHHPQGDGRQRQIADAWSSAASRPSSSSTTPISTARSKASSMRSGSIRARSAAPARGFSCRKALPRSSSRGSSRAWRNCASAIRSTRRSTWAPSSTRVQLERIDSAGEAGSRGRRRLLIRRRACVLRRAASSIRRPC